MKKQSSGPHLVDIHVGRKVKLLRNMAGVTQTELADRLELTFQQVQKYEKGSNRISSSKLFEISQILDRDITEFFEGLGEDSVSSKIEKSGGFGGEISELMLSRDGLRLNRAFVQISDQAVRGKVIALLESLVEMKAKE